MPYPDGTLLKSADQPQVWLVKGGQRHLIPSPDVFNGDGFSWSAILVVSEAEINGIAQGPDVPLYTTWVTPSSNDAQIPGYPPLASVEYNGADYKRWRSSGGGHTIYSNGKFVTQTGAFTGVTVTVNAVMFAGYHSGTAAIVTDTAGRIIWASPLFRVGVNPQGLSGKPMVSTNPWNFQVPVALADQAGGIVIGLTDSPDNLQQILNHSLGALIADLVPAISAIGGLLGGGKKTGTPGQAKTTPAASHDSGWHALGDHGVGEHAEHFALA